MNRRTIIEPTPAKAVERLAEHLRVVSHGAAARGAKFHMAISGGSTPQPLWRLLAGPLREDLPWSSIDLYWSDERMVPPDSDDSNYGVARREFLDHVPLSEDQVHRIHGEEHTPAIAAAHYEEELHERLGSGAGRTTFDLVLLGVGPDGHTASLFPGHASLDETACWVVAEPDPGQPPAIPRVTLTLPAIGASAQVWFLVTGPAKRDTVGKVWREAGTSRPELPAARVTARKEVVWYLDADAAPRGVDQTGRATRGHTA